MSSFGDQPSPWTGTAQGALLVAGPPLIALAIAMLIDANRASTAALVLGGALIAAVLTRALIVIPSSERMVRARLDSESASAELAAERSEQDLRERLERAIVTTGSEHDALRTGLRAVAEVAPDHMVSLLLSVPDEPLVGWRVRLAGLDLSVAEPVRHTPGCTALATGRSTTTLSSAALDACTHLHDPELDVSAICLPLRLDERLLGVVCVQGPPGELPDEAATRQIEWIVERTGIRVTEQRRLMGPAVRDTLDPSTGLPGAETLRLHLRDLVRSLSPFCVAVVELDQQVDDEPDDAADALALVAEVLASTLRPGDLVCRMDGPRLAAVLSHCTAEQATSAAERVREALALELAEFEARRPVTFSAGIVESHRATSLEQIVRLAVGACEQASTAGGNRVMISGEP